MMAMVFGDMLGLDTNKMVRMSLLHDLSESITGDIIPGQMPKEEKITLESNAIKSILSNLPEKLEGEFFLLWDEYIKNETKEARLLHELDKLEMALQASIYSKSYDGSFSEFLESAGDAISNPELKRIFYSLVKE